MVFVLFKKNLSPLCHLCGIYSRPFDQFVMIFWYSFLNLIRILLHSAFPEEYSIFFVVSKYTQISMEWRTRANTRGLETRQCVAMYSQNIVPLGTIYQLGYRKHLPNTCISTLQYSLIQHQPPVYFRINIHRVGILRLTIHCKCFVQKQTPVNSIYICV